MSIYNTLLAQYKNYSDEPPVPPTPGPDYTEPFYFENITNKNITTYREKYSRTDSPNFDVYFSLDKETWEKTDTFTIQPNQKAYVKATTIAWSGNTNLKVTYLRANGLHNIGGNILSLLYGDDFVNHSDFPVGSVRTFSRLFYTSPNLVNAKDLILPSTTVNSCYSEMFNYSARLISLPILPATILSEGCYAYFCSSGSSGLINEITCLATDISASDCTDNWLNGVSATGTFITPSSTQWTTGVSGIPEGWTRVDAT